MRKEYSIYLSLNQDPDLVAIRFSPVYDIVEVAKKSLYAYVDGDDSFRIRLAPENEYMYRPLRFRIHLSSDDKREKVILALIDGMKYSPSVFVKNIIRRFIVGSVDFAYSDNRLREVASQYKKKNAMSKDGDGGREDSTNNGKRKGIDFEKIALGYLKGGSS